MNHRWNLSAATIAYEEASFYYMKMIQTNDMTLKEKTNKLFR